MGIIFHKGCTAVLGIQCGLGGLPQDRTSVVYPIRDGIAIPSSLLRVPLLRVPLFPKTQDESTSPNLKPLYIAILIWVRYFAYPFKAEGTHP
ncbi:MAG: hypothetical protein F6K65_13970 [Moorea sp. SIO3C2]|nr:hypothetical protein [Moorena sp. SIO3C2]